MSEPLFRVIPWNSAASFLPSDLDRDKKNISQRIFLFCR